MSKQTLVSYKDSVSTYSHARELYEVRTIARRNAPISFEPQTKIDPSKSYVIKPLFKSIAYLVHAALYLPTKGLEWVEIKGKQVHHTFILPLWSRVQKKAYEWQERWNRFVSHPIWNKIGNGLKFAVSQINKAVKAVEEGCFWVYKQLAFYGYKAFQPVEKWINKLGQIVHHFCFHLRHLMKEAHLEVKSHFSMSK